MTTEETNNPVPEQPVKNYSNSKGRVLAGIIVIAAGALLFLKNKGLALPEWLVSWQMFLILWGLVIGAMESFGTQPNKYGKGRRKWWMVSLVGLLFLINEFYFNLFDSDFFWPILIIAVGLVIIFKPKRKWNGEHCKTEWKEKMKNHYTEYTERGNPDDYMESVSIFGGVKKNIISKNFKGGEIVCIFGGSEINLMQADINGRVVLEVVQVFGGTKLIVPAHWSVLSEEMLAILGGIEDKRPPYVGNTVDDTKVLVIKGTSIFAGIDIRSY